jgi:hypothetical protein
MVNGKEKSQKYYTGRNAFYAPNYNKWRAMSSRYNYGDTGK